MPEKDPVMALITMLIFLALLLGLSLLFYCTHKLLLIFWERWGVLFRLREVISFFNKFCKFKYQYVWHESRARKISLVQEFLRLDDEKIISALEHLLHKSKSELFEENLKPMSLNQFNNEIDSALDDEKNNRLTDVEDLKK